MDEALRPLGLTTAIWRACARAESYRTPEFVTAQTMHGLSNLELVERRPDPVMAAQARLVMTTTRVLEQAHLLVSEVEDRMMAGMGEPGARKLTASLMHALRG